MRIATFSPKNNLKEIKIGIVFNENKIMDVNVAYTFYLENELEVIDSKQIANAIMPNDMLSVIKRYTMFNRELNNLIKYINKLKEDEVKKHNIFYDLSEVKFRPPIMNPSKIVCIGLNYEDYRKMLGYEKPEVPYFFLKAPSTLIGHEDVIYIPQGRIPETTSNCLFHEFEFAFIIGKRARFVSKNDAEKYIFGYTIFNDITAHDIEMKKIGHFSYQQRSKAFDTFSPVGPWIVTKDQLKDVNNLRIIRRRNGVIECASNTRYMIFKIPEIIEFLTEIMTLEPGDIVSTASPPAGPEDGLKDGDIIEAEIEGIGILKNYVKLAKK
jgi:acylpyruvate hydrolase